MRVFLLLCTLIFACCSDKKEDFFQCAKSAGLFSRENTYPVRFDNYRTFSDIKKLSRQIRDTLQDMTPFGFIYNYADSSFIPNKDSIYNLIVEGILIIPKNHHVNMGGGYLILFITQDSLDIFNEFKNTHEKFYKDDPRIIKSLNAYYNTAYCDKENFWKPKYAHVVIPDSLDLNEYFLPYFRLMIRSYKQSIEKHTSMKNVSICDSSGYGKADYKIRGSIEFMMLIDDFDYERKKVK